MPTSRYALILQPASPAPATALETLDDANAATVAFHDALRELRMRQVGGEVQLFKVNGDRHLLLRQPVHAHRVAEAIV